MPWTGVAGAPASLSLLRRIRAGTPHPGTGDLSRAGRESGAANEGRSITVRGQVAGEPVWALDTYYLSIRDATDHGLILRGDREQFGLPSPPATGSRRPASFKAARDFPMLLLHRNPTRETRTACPNPIEVSVADLNGFRYLGLIIRTSATIGRVSDNLGGKTLELADHGNTISVFLPRAHKLPEPANFAACIPASTSGSPASPLSTRSNRRMTTDFR